MSKLEDELEHSLKRIERLKSNFDELHKDYHQLLNRHEKVLKSLHIIDQRYQNARSLIADMKRSTGDEWFEGESS